MRNHEEQQHRSPRDVPPVGRPRGAAWRSLQADGVVWEGQVLLVGGEVDLAARMIVTHRRVAFVRGGELVLEIPRGWLRQEPVLRRDGILELFVATPESNPFDEPMRVPLRMREGHPAAGHIIAMLAPGGVRRIAPDAMSAIERAKEAAPTPIFGGFWDGVDAVPAGKRGSSASLDDDSPDSVQGEVHAPGNATPLAPVEPPDRLVRLPSNPPRQPNVNAYPIAGLRPRDQRRTPWTLILRIAALTILLAAAAALGAGRLNLQWPGPGIDGILTAPTQVVSGTTPDAATDTPAEPADAALSTADQTALTIGVGGAEQVTTEAGGTEAIAEPAQDVAPTAAPVVAPTKPAIPTPAPAIEADQAVSEAAVDPVVSTTDTAEAEQAAAPDSGESATEPAAASQPAAVAADVAPAQEIVVGSLRMAIPTALQAESLPKYGLPPGTGEWVLLRTKLVNEGEAAATLAMSDVRLFDRNTGYTAQLDSGTDVIASLAGIKPARGASDVIAIDPGDSTEALFLFLLPGGGSDDLALLVGQSTLDLAPSVTAGEASAADEPQLVEATVAEILGGGRIAVDIDGAREDVQYLGMQAPIGDACFADEARRANAELVDGKEVWLERQASDRGEDEALLRDVWIEDAGGNRVLVAARLLEAGAAIADAVAPDTRYQSWLAAASALARSSGAGLWGACGEPTASSGASPASAAPRLAFMSGGWRARESFILR